MKVIAVTERRHEDTVAVIQRHEALNLEFITEIRELDGWGKVTDDELLDAQTFVAWVRGKRGYADKSLEACLENGAYYWSDGMEIEEVPPESWKAHKEVETRGS